MTSDGGIFNLKPLPTHCGLCFESLGDARGNLVGGLHLCPTCDCGELAGRLDFRGFRFGEKVEWMGAYTPKMGSQLYQRLEPGGTAGFVASQVNLARTLPLKAKFFPEHEGGSLLSLFRRELQVGEEMFDKTIYVESSRDEVTRKLLSHPGLQSAIVEVVFVTGKLTLDGAVVRTQKRCGMEEQLHPDVVRRNLAVVAHYVDLFCQHLERPDEVRWPE